LSEEDKVRRFGLFKGLKVAKFDWFIKLHFGNWPVIHDLNYESWDSMLNSIKRRMSNLYMEHHYILDNKKLYTNDKSYFENILNETINESRLMDALSSITRYLYEYF
ncbi:2028_t:CDS:2, partial [Paraglomus brasilianum]